MAQAPMGAGNAEAQPFTFFSENTRPIPRSHPDSHPVPNPVPVLVSGYVAGPAVARVVAVLLIVSERWRGSLWNGARCLRRPRRRWVDALTGSMMRVRVSYSAMVGRNA